MKPQTTILAALLLLAAPLPADQWQLTTAELDLLPVNLVGIDDQGVRARGPAGEQTIPFERFVQLDRTTLPTIADNALSLQLIDGQRLLGQPAGIDQERLRWRNPDLGEISVPLQHVRAIARGPATPDRAAAPPQDLVRMRNDDTATGILLDLTSEAAAIQAGADIVTVPLDSVAAIHLAAAPGGPQMPDRTFLVRLADGSAWQAHAITASGPRAALRLTPDAPRRNVPIDNITAIEHRRGPVTWLSALEPAESVQTPLIGDPWPARMNQTVRGEPLQFRGRNFPRGIGVQAYSRLTWQLEPAHRIFRTRYALDGDLAYAQVTVRIRLDDQIVHEQRQFRAATLSPVITIELHEARRLTLEVDYHRSLDVQARLNWLEPALLK